MQPSLNQSLTKALERSIGVFAGVVIASILGILLGDGTWVIILATVVALFIAWALKMTPGTANQVAISALLVLALGTATPTYALDRVLETLIGAVIGILVNRRARAAGGCRPGRDAVTASATSWPTRSNDSPARWRHRSLPRSSTVCWWKPG